MELAPVILFVYNRPKHTEQTLQALASNDFAQNSILYIYADGPKENATENDKLKIAETRAVLQKKKWCKEVFISESQSNLGLEKSVMKGISEIIKKYGKVIVLEDDILTSRGFLKFMNEALDIYQDTTQVAGISGWGFLIDTKEETYFSRVGSCWGWATWDRVWQNTNWDAMDLLKSIVDSNRIKEFDIDGQYHFFKMLNQQSRGEISSWAVRFYASYFLKNNLFLFPGKSIAKNIGFDGSGTNFTLKNENSFSDINFKKEYVNLKILPIEEQEGIRKKIIESFKPKKGKKITLLKRILNKVIK